MAIAVPMTNPMTGQVAVGLQGFSWTTLFFGPFPALFRGHFVGFLVIILVNLLTFGVTTLIFPFFYNGWHWNTLIAKGFMPNTVVAQRTNVTAASQSIVNVHLGQAQPATNQLSAQVVEELPSQPQLPSATASLPTRTALE
ncbi:MAG TPA: hypothetical protein PLR41_05970 [Alphaproteobacteria bacterium]|nr:hypothetical protein [Alphaproteobacteria bacterium]